MDGWMDKKIQKIFSNPRWMVGWIQKNMKKKYGWLDG